MTYKEILIGVGFHPTDNGPELRMRPIYRDSDNNTSLKVDKKTGHWYDFGTNKHGSFPELIQLSLNLSNIDEAREILSSKFSLQAQEHQPQKPKFEIQKTFPKEILDNLIKNHSYWISRGISENTVKLFGGGIFDKGRLKSRYCFPIFNEFNQLVGLTGRTLVGSDIKYKHLGQKSHWLWPLHLNETIIKECKSVILLESPGCVLTLWDAGIKNTLCLFGTKCSVPILNALIRLDLDKIYLSLNNEPDNNNIGNKAAKQIYHQLTRYFDDNDVVEALPLKKDFGEMTKTEILIWKQKHGL